MKDPFSSDFGKHFSQIVQDAVQSGDYSQLKQAVNATVSEIKQSANSVKNAWTQGQPFPPQEPRPNTYTQPSKPNKPYYTPPQPAQAPPPPPPRPKSRPQPQRYAYPSPQRPAYSGRVVNPYQRKTPGNTASILLLLFGILGLIASGICTVSLLPLFFFERDLIPFIISAAICLPLDVNFIAMIAAGRGLRGRINRFKRYLAVMNGARFFSIEQLAAATGETKDFLVKDLRKMIRKGMFPCAYIDEQNTCLMLDQETYQQYISTKNHLEQKRIQEERQRQLAKTEPPKEGSSAIIAEGRSYIQQIKEANDAIPNEEISAKLYRMESITDKVFAYVEKHPHKLPEIRKFMNYYLPTTLKLVNAYREFDAQTVDGSNITATKKEIQEILDTINAAFENLLDNLFQDDAMDISTDISALNIMLAQDGLKDSDFKLE